MTARKPDVRLTGGVKIVSTTSPAETTATATEETSSEGSNRKEAVRRWVGVAALVCLLVWPVLAGAPMLLVGVAALLLAVMLHELGHLLAARWCGMKVTDYYLGFGPKLFSFRRGETNYGVRLVPAGGYVNIIGMHSGVDVDPADEHRTYRAASFPRRAITISAGSLMHLLLAVLLLLVAHVFIGTQAYADDRWQVTEVAETLEGGPSPASVAGLLPGDQVVSVNGTPTPTWQAMREELTARAGQDVTLGVERGDSLLTLQTTLAGDGPAAGFLGVQLELVAQRETQLPHVAAWSAGRDFVSGVWLTVSSLGRLATSVPEVVDAVVSPPNDPTANENLDTRPLSVVGLVNIGSDPDWSVAQLLTLFALVNVFFAMFNMLPLLPFDGGHLAVAVYERWRERGGKERHLVNMRRLVPLTAAGMLLIVLLGLGAIYLDIANPVDFG